MKGTMNELFVNGFQYCWSYFG